MDVGLEPGVALLTARLLTAVGLLRASMGPPIMTIVRGVASPRLAISDTAASTGTVGWQTEITWRLGADVADELLHVFDVVVQMERARPTPAPCERRSSR